QPSTGLVFLGNGKTAESRGIEAATSYRITSNLSLNLTLADTNAKLTADAPGIGGVNGDRLPLSPRFNGAFSVDYRHPLAADSSYTLGGSYRYVGDFWNGIPSAAGSILERQSHPFDFFGSLQFDRYNLRLYVRNAFNSENGFER